MNETSGDGETTMGTMTIRVKRYSDGETVGTVEMAVDEWESYADCTHEAYQWPEGLALAGDVLTEEQREEMGLDDNTTIWLAE
jgi:hypothetical protein